MTGFALANEVGWLTWDAGTLGGFPEALVDQGREALRTSPRGATPTGPWFETSTPQGAWIALVPLVPGGEAVGAPEFVEQPDELDVPAGAAEAILEGADISGAMIALYPSPAVARRLAVEGGDPASQLHVTLKFLGPDASKIDAKLLDKVGAAVRSFAATCPVMTGHVSGIGEFAGKPDVDEKPVFAKLDIPGVQAFRKALVAALPGGVMEDTYDDFKTHMTLMYVPKSKKVKLSIPEMPVVFDAVWLVVGGKKERFPLGGKVEEADYEEVLHPRGRAGEWIRKPFHELKVGDPIRHVETGARGTVQYMGSSGSWLTAKWNAKANADLPTRFSGSSGSVEHAEPEQAAAKMGGGLAAAIELPKSGKAKGIAAESIAVIDRLLDLPALAPIKLKPTQKKGTRGGYERTEIVKGGQTVPESIHLSTTESDLTPGAEHLTMAHEVGHFLDNQVFGGDPRLGRAFESLQTLVSNMTDEVYEAMDDAAKETYPRRPSVLDDWKEAVEASPPVKRLRGPVSFLDAETVRYLLNPKELLARSFAQWVAIRSGDEAMMRGLDAWRNLPEVKVEYRENWRGEKVAREVPLPKWQHDRQWTDDEFEPIAAAFDEAFEWMGILRKP